MRRASARVILKGSGRGGGKLGAEREIGRVGSRIMANLLATMFHSGKIIREEIFSLLFCVFVRLINQYNQIKSKSKSNQNRTKKKKKKKITLLEQRAGQITEAGAPTKFSCPKVL